MNLWRRVCAGTGERRHYRKGDLFLRQGEVARCMGVVRRGYFKFAITDTGGSEHITGFSFRNTLVGDYYSSLYGTPAQADIIAATDAEVLQCSTDVMKHLFTELPELRQTFSDALFRQAYGLYLDTHRLTPKKRYEALISRYPGILHDITLKELASYLQVTPTHLSRIRKEITFG